MRPYSDLRWLQKILKNSGTACTQRFSIFLGSYHAEQTTFKDLEGKKKQITSICKRVTSLLWYSDCSCSYSREQCHNGSLRLGRRARPQGVRATLPAPARVLGSRTCPQRETYVCLVLVHQNEKAYMNSRRAGS